MGGGSRIFTKRRLGIFPKFSHVRVLKASLIRAVQEAGQLGGVIAGLAIGKNKHAQVDVELLFRVDLTAVVVAVNKLEHKIHLNDVTLDDATMIVPDLELKVEQN